MNSGAVWRPCSLCGDYWCELHDMHTHDCECPTLEEIVESGQPDPYLPGSLEKVRGQGWQSKTIPWPRERGDQVG